MTAVHLLRNAHNPLQIYLFHDGSPFGKGVAYGTTSPSHLLNVVAAKMSAFPDQPGHLLDWLETQPFYSQLERSVRGQVFLPRQVYGAYLEEVWAKALREKSPEVAVEIINARVTDLIPEKEGYLISVEKHKALRAPVRADFVVLATGNEAPANPQIINTGFYASPRYFQNPWESRATEGLSAEDQRPVIIIGNGLTMVDTVLSLLDRKFRGKIFSVSPHGFALLPHRHHGMEYSGLTRELPEHFDLNQLYALFHKHVALLRQFGLSAEPLVDSLRSHSGEIWQSLSVVDKRRFLRHIRRHWDTARHRLPIHIYDLMQQLRIEGRLVVKKGRLLDVVEQAETGQVLVRIMEKTGRREEYLEGQRVINCTGPLTDISRSANPLLRQLAERGLIHPDALHLGIEATELGAVLLAGGRESRRLFTLGGNLRGVFWESTAVPELREQAQSLGRLLAEEVKALAEVAVV